MATRRMFSKTVTNSSRFLMMPQSSQNLYFHIGMNADDDGFCEHFTVMRMTESKPDDLRILQAKRLVHVFDDQVLIVLDWKENNYLRSDRYTKSKYLEIYKEEILSISEGKTPCLPVGIPDGNTGKVRLGKDSIGKDSIRLKRFTPPTFEEVSQYCCDTNIDIDVIKFIDYNEARGWTIGKSKIKDWKATVRTWSRNDFKSLPKIPVKKSLSELAKENEELFA